MISKPGEDGSPRERIDTARAAERLSSIRLSTNDARKRGSEVYGQMLKKSPHMHRGNFTIADPGDLERLFTTYDAFFLDGLARSLLDAGGHKISFRFSSRMTSSGGKTSRRPLGRSGSPYAFEIAISTVLLSMGFDDDARAITVCGLECGDRLAALQRVFEHELVHLLEMLIWGKSSCARRRFAEIAESVFGHTETTHRMVTPREHAAVEHGIRAGDRVSFEFEGTRQAGVVNRITRRATILVENARGRLYSNGKRYAKFYVPVDALRRV